MKKLQVTNNKNQCISTIPGVDELLITNCSSASNWDTQEFAKTSRLTTGNGMCATNNGLGFGDQITMAPCSDAIAQKFYLSKDGNLRAAETLNYAAANKNRKVYDDGCIGHDKYNTLITDRSGFGRNYRTKNTNNSRICESRFSFEIEPAQEIDKVLFCDDTIHGADITSCDYKTGKWVTDKSYLPREEYFAAGKPFNRRENYAPVGQLPNQWPVRSCPVADHPTKKCIEVVTGGSIRPQQKIVCKQNYYGKDCDLYLADDTISTPIAWNSAKTKETIIGDMIREKCERGFDEINNKKYCDQILPGSWNKIGRDINRSIVNEARDAYASWLNG